MNDELTEPRVSRGLLITLAAVAALALVFLFVIQPMLMNDDAAAPVEPVVALSAPATPAPGAAGEAALDEDPAVGDPGDDDATDPDQGGAAAAGQPDEPAERPKPKRRARQPVTETFEVFSARDPFQQLVVAPSEQGAGTGEQTTNTDGGTDSGSETGATPPDSSGGTTSVDGTIFEVTDVYVGDDGEPVALVTVNGKGYEVREGDVFAEHFEVLDLDESCGTFRYGDERFTLCEGEQIRK